VLDGTAPPAPDVAAIVAAATKFVIEQTIDIPRIVLMPEGEIKAGFRPFKLDLSGMTYSPPSQELWLKHLRTDRVETIGFAPGTAIEARPEDYVVSGLIDFPDVAYDENADLLYDLASQVVAHFRGYLSDQECDMVLALHQREIARAVHAQMLEHYWLDDTVEYERTISQGFTPIKRSAFTGLDEPPRDYRLAPPDKSTIARYVYGGFTKCLTDVTKFQSDPERKLAVILERESLKWFRPATGQFFMFYRSGHDQREYQPDFVAEMPDCIAMLEPKRSSEMNDKIVLAKRDVAVQWCSWATTHAQTYGGKAWTYGLIPHDAIADNVTIDYLLKQYESRS